MNDIATRGSRRMFSILWWGLRCPLTISSPSMPTQTTVTCGLPSLFSVVRWAAGPVAMRFRTDSGIVMVRPPGVVKLTRSYHSVLGLGTVDALDGTRKSRENPEACRIDRFPSVIRLSVESADDG